jgi:hypothetical protein
VAVGVTTRGGEAALETEGARLGLAVTNDGVDGGVAGTDVPVHPTRTAARTSPALTRIDRPIVVPVTSGLRPASGADRSSWSRHPLPIRTSKHAHWPVGSGSSVLGHASEVRSMIRSHGSMTALATKGQ